MIAKLIRGHLSELTHLVTYRREGKDVPEAIVRNCVDLDKLIEIVEDKGRFAGLKYLVSLPMTALQAWRILGDLLEYEEFREKSTFFYELIVMGEYTIEASSLLGYPMDCYQRLSEGTRFVATLDCVYSDDEAWMLAKAFGQQLDNLTTQKLDPSKFCKDSYLAICEQRYPVLCAEELERIELARKLGLEFFILVEM